MAQTLVDISLLKDREVASLLDTAVTNIAAGILSSFAGGILQDSIVKVTGGTGYAVGDTVTLTCTNSTISVNPIVVVSAVSAGAITGFHVTEVGQFTALNAQVSATLTQSATSGVGTGFTCTANFGPIAAKLAAPSLNTGGNNDNGNLFIGAEQPNSSLYGSENTLIGDRAGGLLTGVSSFNTAVGHGACGPGGGVPFVGNSNTMLGSDSGRNINGGSNNTLLGAGSGKSIGTENDTTAIGTNALQFMNTGIATSRNTAIGGSAMQGVNGLMTQVQRDTAVGYGSLAAATTGKDDVALGYQCGNKITTGNNNVTIGSGVASTTLTTGSNNVLIGTTSDIDTAASSDSNIIRIGAGNTAIISAIGCGTPATSIITIAGTLIVAGTNAAITHTGITFANRPPTPVAGMVCYFTDSTVATWGSTIAGTGANKVLGWYNGTNWTVVAV